MQTVCDSYTLIDGNVFDASNNSATHTLTIVAGCDSVVTLDLTVNTVSDVASTLNGVTITATNTNATYQWLNCDNNNEAIDGETNQSFIAVSNGNYAVELTENDCVKTSLCVSVTTVGITEFGKNISINTYPNPTTNNIHLESGEEMNDVELVLTDVHGKLISKQKYGILSKTIIELGKSPGVYSLSIKTQENQTTLKLFKE